MTDTLNEACTNEDRMMLMASYHISTLYKVICCHVKNSHQAEAALVKTIKEIESNKPVISASPKHTPVWMAGVARSIAKRVVNDQVINHRTKETR